MTTLSHESTMRKICNEFFDALESGDIARVGAFYADDMTMWVNTTGQTMSRDDNLKALEDGKKLHRRRLYNDRRINAQRGLVNLQNVGVNVPVQLCNNSILSGVLGILASGQRNRDRHDGKCSLDNGRD